MNDGNFCSHLLFQVIPVWWHCLVGTMNFKNLMAKKSHRWCIVTLRGQKPRHFCECGYKNNGETFEEFLKRPVGGLAWRKE